MADIKKSDIKIVELNEVLHRLKISQSTLYRMMSRGEFPRQLKLGSRSFWVESEIQLFIDQMFVERKLSKFSCVGKNGSSMSRSYIYLERAPIGGTPLEV